MKVYSILFEAKLVPGKISLFTGLCKDSDEALQLGTTLCIQQYGDLLWTPRVANNLDVKPIKTADNQAKMTEAAPLNYDKNWVMKTIIDSKDINLFNAMRGHLSENEVNYLQEHINKSV